MLTYTGLSITPDSIQAPAPMDLAVQMYRMCRYAGAVDCSLLLHSLLVAILVDLEADDNTWTWALLHDANEVVLGDIPHPWKTPERKMVEDALDEAIARRYGVFLDQIDKALIKRADRSAFWFETDALGPLLNREQYISRWVTDGFKPMRPEVGTRVVHQLSSILNNKTEAVSMAHMVFDAVESRRAAEARRRVLGLVDTV